METQFLDWENVEKWLKTKIAKYESKDKKYSKWHVFISKIAFFIHYMQAYTTFYPNVWLPDREVSLQKNPNKLEHESVHLLDQKTLFGWLWFLPGSINKWLFYFLYAIPQIFFLLAFLAIFYSNWWLLSLLFLLPLPAPFRTFAELRGYRRSIELGRDVETVVPRFTESSYYFMFPFKSWARKLLLKKPSPYKEEMDKIRVYIDT